MWAELEKSETKFDRLDPYNVVGMGHTLRVETPAICVNTKPLKASIEQLSLTNHISSFEDQDNTFPFQRGHLRYTQGIHNVIGSIFQVGQYWNLDFNSVSLPNTQMIEIAPDKKTLKIRHEARAQQLRNMRQNTHNYPKHWFHCMGNKTINAGIFYFEVSTSRSEAWKVGISARNEQFTSKYSPDP